jgi:hypothetical protein
LGGLIAVQGIPLLKCADTSTARDLGIIMNTSDTDKRNAIIQELQQRRSCSANFHNHKESVVYIAFGFSIAAFSYWLGLPDYKKVDALLYVLTCATVLNHLFIRDQLNRRWHSSLQHSAYIAAIRKMIIEPDASDITLGKGKSGWKPPVLSYIFPLSASAFHTNFDHLLPYDYQCFSDCLSAATSPPKAFPPPISDVLVTFASIFIAAYFLALCILKTTLC